MLREPLIAGLVQRVARPRSDGFVPRSAEAPRCPLDGRRMRPWLEVPADCKKAEPNRFSEVFRCEDCGYGQVHPLPTEDQVPDFYRLERYYTHGGSHFEQEGAISLLDRTRQHVAWRLDFGESLLPRTIDELLGAPEKTVCDIGCGAGSLAGGIAELGHRVVGVEPDPNSIARELRDKIEFFAGSAERLPQSVRARRFDCVILSHVLEHCIDPLLALQNARALLAPQGLLVCEVPNNAALGLRFAGAAWEMLDVPRHLHFFDGVSLQGFLDRAGLKATKTSYAGYCRKFKNDWIATEKRLWHALVESASSPHPRPRPNSKLRAWQLLTLTALAPAQLKYDSIRVVARAA
jgi:2-polyprenyl-3-methyl-5-hydroxy-6-metoxy-1,4-benzoquinol methylase